MRKNIIRLVLIVLSLFILDPIFFIRNCQGQWVQTSGPGGGSIPCIAGSGDNIFAGTYDGGIFKKSGDGWYPVNNGLSNLHVLSLALSGTYLYAGTLGSGVFLSSDNGDSWVNIGLNNYSVNCIAVIGTIVFA